MQMKDRLLARIDKLDTLGRRDRMSLALGLLAALVGIEMTLVQATQTKRQRIEQTTVDDAASQAQAQASAAADLATQRSAAEARSTQLQASLAALGLKDGMKPTGQRESLAAFLSRSLRNQNVVLVATQNLPVETVNTAAPGDEAVAVAVSAAPAASGIETTTLLFRHRTELTLEGSVASLTETVDLLERELAPLRIERVRLAPRGASGALQATVVLTTINQERTWLAL
jgi:hypothetical protein